MVVWPAVRVWPSTRTAAWVTAAPGGMASVIPPRSSSVIDDPPFWSEPKAVNCESGTVKVPLGPPTTTPSLPTDIVLPPSVVVSPTVRVWPLMTIAPDDPAAPVAASTVIPAPRPLPEPAVGIATVELPPLPPTTMPFVATETGVLFMMVVCPGWSVVPLITIAPGSAEAAEITTLPTVTAPEPDPLFAVPLPDPAVGMAIVELPPLPPRTMPFVATETGVLLMMVVSPG